MGTYKTDWADLMEPSLRKAFKKGFTMVNGSSIIQGNPECIFIKDHELDLNIPVDEIKDIFK